jgi:hypothetical protein
MAVADSHGLPVAVCVESATPHEVKLATSTLVQMLVPEAPQNLIGDNASRRTVHETRYAIRPLTYRQQAARARLEGSLRRAFVSNQQGGNNPSHKLATGSGTWSEKSSKAEQAIPRRRRGRKAFRSFRTSRGSLTNILEGSRMPRQRVGLRQMDEQPEARPHHTAVKEKRDEVERLACFPPRLGNELARY